MHTDSLVDLRRAPKPARERHEWCYRLIEMISKSAGCRGQRRVRIWPVTHRRSIWAPRIALSGNPIRRRDSPRDLAFELRICTRLCPRRIHLPFSFLNRLLSYKMTKTYLMNNLVEKVPAILYIFARRVPSNTTYIHTDAVTRPGPQV